MSAPMSLKVKISAATVVFLWATAFVGIRAGLHDFSPEGLALYRYTIASLCMAVVYYSLPVRTKMPLRDACGLLAIGALGIGFYSIMLNYGEITISSGMASFIISQSPIITAIFAISFLGEKINFSRILGFTVSVLGVILIATGEKGGFKWDVHISYILLATLAGSCFSILQKPFLKKYHAIQAATYVVWGGTLFLLMYIPQLKQDLSHASLHTSLIIAYLGIFPAAVGYIGWSYVLAEMPASRAVSFLYFMPFMAMLLGWLWMGEIPVWMSVAGGLLAIAGVWLVNHSYRQPKVAHSLTEPCA